MSRQQPPWSGYGGAEPYREPVRRRRPGVVRTLHRRRWQLVPVGVGVLAYLTAVLAGADPGTVAAGGIPLVVVGGWQLKRSPLRPAEVLYARVVLAAVALWVAAAVTFGLHAVWVQAANPLGVVVLGVPWWRHRSVRGRVRVEKLLGAWDDWAGQAGAGGVRAVSGTAGRVADRLRLELPRGRMRADELGQRLLSLAQVKGLPEHALRLDTGITKTDPGLVDILITHDDPWRDAHGVPVDIVHPAVVDPMGWVEGGHSICQPIPYGLDENGREAVVSLRLASGGRLVVITSKKGGGKTVTINNLLAGLTRCGDKDVVLINLKEGGKSTREWAPAVLMHATTAQQARKAMQWVEQEEARRAAQTRDPVMVPTPYRRAIVVVIDEYSLLASLAPAVAEAVERRAKTMRSASGAMVLADQRVDSVYWTGGLRSQVDDVLAGRMERVQDAKGIFKAWREVDLTAFPEELAGLMAHYAGVGRPVVMSRSWRLEHPDDIGGLVALVLSVTAGDSDSDGLGARDSDSDTGRDSDSLGYRDSDSDRAPVAVGAAGGDSDSSRYDMSPGGDTLPPRSTFGEDATPQDQHPLPYVRGSGAQAARSRVDTVLRDVAAAGPPAVADLSREQLRRLAAERPPADDPTPDEVDLDELIKAAIRDAGHAGASMAELVEDLDRARSTIQMRCSLMARLEPAPIHAQPPRGRHARWYWGPPPTPNA